MVYYKMNSIYKPAEDSYLLSLVLKNEIPKLLNKNSKLKVIEIGCGSGIQLQTLKKLKVENIFSCDINTEAVEYCKKLEFNGIQSDLFSKIKDKFDLIIFNPPYLPQDSREPKESRVATTGGKHGSEIINKFLKLRNRAYEKNKELLERYIRMTEAHDRYIINNNIKNKIILDRSEMDFHKKEDLHVVIDLIKNNLEV